MASRLETIYVWFSFESWNGQNYGCFWNNNQFNVFARKMTSEPNRKMRQTENERLIAFSFIYKWWEIISFALSRQAYPLLNASSRASALQPFTSFRKRFWNTLILELIEIKLISALSTFGIHRALANTNPFIIRLIRNATVRWSVATPNGK